MKNCLSIKVEKDLEKTELFLLSKELFLTRREFSQTEERITNDTFGSAWILFFGKIPDNKIFVSNNKEWLPLNHNQILFIPPFNIVKWKLLPGAYEWWALSSDTHLKNMPAKSCLYQIPKNFKINHLDHIQDLIISPALFEITNATHPHYISGKIKQELDSTFKEEIKIKEIINKFSACYSTAYDYFKKDYGFTPLDYLRRIRYFHTMDQIMFRGKSVFEAGINAGLHTPSQIYRLYKEISNINPEQYSWKNLRPDQSPDFNRLF